ncbi:MAG: hypothetical protein SGILL_009142 [Bacillariaceae sp.]
MATPLKLRPYQEESLAHAKRQNTIINLETGRGKTLIAAKLIEYYLKIKPNKRVAFMVPSRPLVDQQSKYCTTHCRLPCGKKPPVIQTLFGQNQDGWSMAEWQESFRKSHVFLGTPAIFLDAFVIKKALDIGSFSLIVFDECHHACGNSPMAQIMRDSVAPTYERCSDVPRILGLTASFINGEMKNPEKKRRKLEELMLSNVFCPQVPARTSDDDFRSVAWSKHVMEDEVELVVKKKVEETVKSIGIKEVRKIVNNSVHVLLELGTKALQYYINKVIVAQIKSKASQLQEQTEERAKKYSNKMLLELPALEKALEHLEQSLDTDSTFNRAPSTSLKADELIQLVQRQFSEHGQKHRGLVFVERIALVSPLAKVLNDALQPLGVKCGAVAGTGSQTELERQKHLEMFRQGELHLLATTAALEEGIDVPECAFVVRYTCVTTTKAHIQGAGRARHKNAVIYYFENDPLLERNKEASLIAAASNISLNLSQVELKAAVTTISHSHHPRHPYPFRRDDKSPPTQGELNVYNCKRIFNEYCSIALGKSVSPEKVLYRYETRVAPPGTTQRLAAIRYPGPTRWLCFTYDKDYRPWWGNDPPETIFVNDRLRNKSAAEKEEMSFVYFVCAMMRTCGHLDENNQPSAKVITDAKRNCPIDPDWSSFEDITVKNTVFQSY